jgi:hypothetical protein
VPSAATSIRSISGPGQTSEEGQRQAKAPGERFAVASVTPYRPKPWLAEAPAGGCIRPEGPQPSPAQEETVAIPSCTRTWPQLRSIRLGPSPKVSVQTGVKPRLAAISAAPGAVAVMRGPSPRPGSARGPLLRRISYNLKLIV